MCAPIDMKPAWPNDSWPTVMGRNMLSPMIMLIPIVIRSASPSENRPVTTPTSESITAYMACASLPARFDLEPTAEEPGRFVEEDQDEDAEGEAVLPRGDQIGHAHGLDHAEDERGHHGAHDVPGSAEQHDRQALEPERPAHQWCDVVGEPDQH